MLEEYVLLVLTKGYRDLSMWYTSSLVQKQGASILEKVNCSLKQYFRILQDQTLPVPQLCRTMADTYSLCRVGVLLFIKLWWSLCVWPWHPVLSQSSSWQSSSATSTKPSKPTTYTLSHPHLTKQCAPKICHLPALGLFPGNDRWQSVHSQRLQYAKISWIRWLRPCLL